MQVEDQLEENLDVKQVQDAPQSAEVKPVQVAVPAKEKLCEAIFAEILLKDHGVRGLRRALEKRLGLPEEGLEPHTEMIEKLAVECSSLVRPFLWLGRWSIAMPNGGIYETRVCEDGSFEQFGKRYVLDRGSHLPSFSWPDGKTKQTVEESTWLSSPDKVTWITQPEHRVIVWRRMREVKSSSSFRWKGLWRVLAPNGSEKDVRINEDGSFDHFGQRCILDLNAKIPTFTWPDKTKQVVDDSSDSWRSTPDTIKWITRPQRRVFIWKRVQQQDEEEDTKNTTAQQAVDEEKAVETAVPSSPSPKKKISEARVESPEKDVARGTSELALETPRVKRKTLQEVQKMIEERNKKRKLESMILLEKSTRVLYDFDSTSLLAVHARSPVRDYQLWCVDMDSKTSLREVCLRWALAVLKTELKKVPNEAFAASSWGGKRLDLDSSLIDLRPELRVQGGRLYVTLTWPIEEVLDPIARVVAAVSKTGSTSSSKVQKAEKTTTVNKRVKVKENVVKKEAPKNQTSQGQAAPEKKESSTKQSTVKAAATKRKKKSSSSSSDSDSCDLGLVNFAAKYKNLLADIDSDTEDKAFWDGVKA
jgi:hypothetical protein